MFALAVVMILLAVAFVVLAVRCTRFHARSLRLPRTPVASLVPGPVVVAGVMRAKEQTLPTLLGKTALAVHTVLSAVSETSDGNSSHAMPEDFVSVDAELSDGSTAIFGRPVSCVVETEDMILLGNPQAFSLSVDAFRRTDAALCERTELPEGCTSVAGTQLVLSEGVPCLVLGQVAEQVDEQGRRRITGDPQEPLIVAVGNEREARRNLLQPCHLHLFMASLSLLAALVLFATDRYAGR
jgi:hypothetical protein